MTRKLFSTALILSVVSAVPQTSSANDILDFLRAINGTPAHHGHVDTRRGQLDPRLAHADIHHDARGRSSRFEPVSIHRGHDHNRGRGITTSPRFQPVNRRSGVSFNVSFGNPSMLAQAPPPAIYPPAPAPFVLPAPPVPGSFGHLPHELGQMITCPVPIETHVEIRNACRVAPGAIPAVIAVRDPHLGRFRSRGCVEQLAYVEILVPQCPLQRVRVSPCKTRIRLDYGKYEIDITSKNDCVVINYRD